MRYIIWAFFFVVTGLFPAAAQITSSEGDLSVERMVSGLDEPWSVAFLPDGSALITERDGRLLRLHRDALHEIDGLPPVFAEGQGGLLDVLVPDDFAKTREIFFTFAKETGGRASTALASARLSPDWQSLLNVTIVFEATPKSYTARHFGSRIVEARDGKLFVTLGERGDRDEAQNLATHNGTIIRLNRDGSVPGDNPFLGVDGALPEIWSYGHRNPQGAALDLRGQLWINEHGAEGGDEVNRIEKGRNYGWPVIAYGRHYTGFKIGEGTRKDGMEQPVVFWDPSIAPSGMMIYSGKLWPAWKGNMFVGSLKFDYIARLNPANNWSEEQLESGQTGRVRDVREAPDGSIWYLSVDEGAAFRITPAP